MLIENSMDGTNPFNDLTIAASYENWYATIGLRPDRLEKALLKRLLRVFPGSRTILEIGCGTGHFTSWFGGLGFHAVGVDLSQPMLMEANRLGGMSYIQGDALRLPLLSRSFDIVALLTTLEFLSEPIQALAEALRLARHGLLLGVLNTNSWLGREYRSTDGPVLLAAHFFTLDELKRMIVQVFGENCRIVWRTTLWQFWPWALPLPWGGFIGMAVKIQG
jgi:ubiquinone/menaquinone biosynthesis C-methylase UbiE